MFSSFGWCGWLRRATPKQRGPAGPSACQGHRVSGVSPTPACVGSACSSLVVRALAGRLLVFPQTTTVAGSASCTAPAGERTGTGRAGCCWRAGRAPVALPLSSGRGGLALEIPIGGQDVEPVQVLD